MKEEFLNLYDYIINSKDQENMQILGKITKDMMMSIIDAHPQWAKEYLDILQAVKWHNYLTRKEAEKIVANMVPKPIWSTYTVWLQEITNTGLPQEEEPYYNKEALFTTMAMVCSDSSETIMNIMGLPNDLFISATKISETNRDSYNKFFRAVYRLAIDKLTDKDKMFNIRSYFKL